MIKSKDESVDLFELYNMFLTTRRGNGKDYTKQIMKALVERRKEDQRGWVRARDLKKLISCHEGTLFRLLDGLTKNKIVEKNKRPTNRNVSSYRLSPSYPSFYFLTDAEIRANYNQLFHNNIELEFDLVDALYVLNRHDLLPEYEQERENTRNVGEGYQKWRERKIKSASLQQIQ